MNRRLPAGLTAAGLALTLFGAAAVGPDDSAEAPAPPPSVEEARQRARLLHGTIHDTLQIVHARYYREDEGLMIPAASFKQVFQEVEERDGVKLRWLVVDGRAMNIDHNPKDDFEKGAAKALASGRVQHELVADGVYRYAGPITLRAECLKCHAPGRSSNKSRTAGLLISIPIAKK
ncbi:c-type heme family protein [Tundrisphaera sp. TA3]|uniref:c-type heme family protein n=1 Tax=Tundrisphaera sp. TA3 TaxID=3435775 RepID=UPI003EB80595